MNLYIVIEIGWEYDDNTYQRPACGGGVPVQAYRSREKAEAECLRRNEEAARSNGGMTTSSYDDATGDEEEVAIADFYEVVAVEEGDVA